jgi:hypothetical protein
MLYLYFADGLDQAKISIYQFFDYLLPFCQDEEPSKLTYTTFKILDFDNDNEINVINLCQLIQGIPNDSKFGQELLKVLDYFFEKL